MILSEEKIANIKNAQYLTIGEYEISRPFLGYFNPIKNNNYFSNIAIGIKFFTSYLNLNMNNKNEITLKYSDVENFRISFDIKKSDKIYCSNINFKIVTKENKEYFANIFDIPEDFKTALSCLFIFIKNIKNIKYKVNILQTSNNKELKTYKKEIMDFIDKILR